MNQDEVEAENLQTLGPRLGPLYSALWQEVSWLFVKWLEQRALYETPASVSLLNQTAPFYFRVSQIVLRDDIFMHIARLTEACQSGRRAREHLTIQQFPAALTDGELVTRVRRRISAAVKAASFAEAWRNKRLAHNDLKLALDDSADPLPEVTRQEIEDALDAIAETMHEVQSHFWPGRRTAYEYFRTNGDAKALLYHLGVSVRTEERRMARLQRGEWKPEDE